MWGASAFILASQSCPKSWYAAMTVAVGGGANHMGGMSGCRASAAAEAAAAGIRVTAAVVVGSDSRCWG